MPAGSTPRQLRSIQESLSGQHASFPSLPQAGGGHHDSSTGVHPVPDTFEYVWALVQPVANGAAAPVGAECSLRHSWQQREPAPGGCWNTPTYPLSGNTTVNPAFEEKGVAITNTAVIVQLRPGAAYWDNTNSTTQQEWLFSHC